MSITSDPRTVTRGRVRISPTSTVKRAALIGRVASVEVRPNAPHRGQVVLARIEKVDGMYATARVLHGEYAGQTVRTDAVVYLMPYSYGTWAEAPCVD
jgi:exosome complex RNA-binding protein Csl4